MVVAAREFDRESRRVLRRYAEAESFVLPLQTYDYGLYVKRNNWKKPVLRIAEPIWTIFVKRDLVTQRRHANDQIIWVLSEAGRALWRRLEQPDDPFRAQHQSHDTRMVATDGALARVKVNEAESPLAWLHRRKGSNGKLLISADQFEAGEQLRHDFTLAAIDARVTMDWSFSLGAKASGGRPRDPAEVSDMALAARQRFALAKADVGPGLWDLLVEVCCCQRGLEEIERHFGWPQRSGKVVLQIALDRLIQHYAKGRRPSRRRA